VVDARVDDDVDFLFFWAFTWRTRTPPDLEWLGLVTARVQAGLSYLNVATDGVAHDVGVGHDAGYLLLRDDEQRMMEQRVKQKRQDHDGLVLPKLVDQITLTRWKSSIRLIVVVVSG
jgi:hypothetical protein